MYLESIFFNVIDIYFVGKQNYLFTYKHFSKQFTYWDQTLLDLFFVLCLGEMSFLFKIICWKTVPYKWSKHIYSHTFLRVNRAVLLCSEHYLTEEFGTYIMERTKVHRHLQYNARAFVIYFVQTLLNVMHELKSAILHFQCELDQ